MHYRSKAKCTLHSDFKVAVHALARPQRGNHVEIFLQLFSKNAFTKIMAVVVLAMPLVVVSGYAYSKTTGKKMGASMFQTYSVLQDTPGARAGAAAAQPICAQLLQLSTTVPICRMAHVGQASIRLAWPVYDNVLDERQRANCDAEAHQRRASQPAHLVADSLQARTRAARTVRARRGSST
jgi:hypothetical protein